MMLAETSVARLIARLSRIDLPVWSGVVRASNPTELKDARDVAFARADEVGRRRMLDMAHEHIARAYAQHLGGLGLWTAVFAVPIPLALRDRAASQLIIEDLVSALIVEDIAPDKIVETLQADGERLLRWRATDNGSLESDDDGAAPIDPFRGPLIGASPARGIVLLIMAVVLGVSL